MNLCTREYLKNNFEIEDRVIELAEQAEKDAKQVFDRIDEIKQINQLKVIKAMQDNKLSDSHFNGTTGYGYDDRGRDVLDSVYAEVFKAEDALVRHHIVSGTQALSLCLFGNLRPGDELAAVTGKPYDTLEEVIGIRGENCGSLKEFGVTYRQVDLKQDGKPDLDSIKKAVSSKTKMAMIQRSRGYSWRDALCIEDIRSIVKTVKAVNNDIIIMVDNCYGEFVEEVEPIEAGADIIAGSLIKNPGGGLAVTGGYIAGKRKLVEQCAYRLTSPGLGKEVGASLGNNRLMFQGLFMAPHVVSESLKGAVFCAALMKRAGFETLPAVDSRRSDIIQAVRFNNADCLIAFCQGIQKGSPVDSYVTPQPWDMPGYDSPVIMAAGAFVQGSSIELSADAPLKEPYVAYMQGGLVYEHVKLGNMIALQKLFAKGMGQHE
ncbi:cystathionine beta-lyase family protein involved in aluminum resistance [Ruminiclostridium sufflavum DSM 19573]|uniref:Cystathionine beta-lyase family protein involved in aluminum resistance n=1 Tax=Ruminiclostridium sufflavum DSM 19573 TaxID=1121337 RepID=A0A318XRD4_9FIRM|nr:methionine gamma-lyase family protein [Ruminiclostridium sufflavum]PYG89893.1 cystathionine beta-lyase family protein involved in aluminum resistance [Ruminiclostridium sufflavum DSM 19573]